MAPKRKIGQKIAEDQVELLFSRGSDDEVSSDDSFEITDPEMYLEKYSNPHHFFSTVEAGESPADTTDVEPPFPSSSFAASSAFSAIPQVPLSFPSSSFAAASGVSTAALLQVPLSFPSSSFAAASGDSARTVYISLLSRPTSSAIATGYSAACRSSFGSTSDPLDMPCTTFCSSFIHTWKLSKKTK